MALSQNLRGIAAILVATGSFVANDTCMKLALADAPPFQVLVMRGIAAIIWCLPVIFAMGIIRELPRAFHPWVLLRSGCELVAILAFITALAHMPIADLTAIAQISPLVVLLGMWVFFGERVGGFRLFLVGLGITGALMVAQPGGIASSPFAIFGFLTAVGAAFRDILSRKVPARVVAPFNYAFMIWAGISGVLVFGQVPNALAIAGMALIMAAGLAVVFLEGRGGKVIPAVAEV